MKRVLLAFDGEHFSESVFEFVRRMNLAQPVHAVGFFLPALDHVELLYSFGGVPSGPLFITETVAGDKATVKKNIARFEVLCKENNIDYSIDDDPTRHIINMVRTETLFADLIVIDGKSVYDNVSEEVRDEYISGILHKSSCPVVVLPPDYVHPTSVILTYDASEPAIFAIKQFSYLFPELLALPTLLVYFGRKGEAIPKRREAEALFKSYFRHLTITKLHMPERLELEKWVDGNRNSVVVAGAKGRSSFSELFRKSFVEGLVAKHVLPLFIAHH